MEEPGRLQSMGSQRVPPTEHLHFHFFTLRGLELLLNLSTISMTDTVVYCVCVCVCVCVCAVTQSCLNLLRPHLVHQASLSMGLFWQEYWSGLPLSPPRDLPDPGIESASPSVPALIGDSLTLSHQRRFIYACMYVCIYVYIYISDSFPLLLHDFKYGSL